MDRGSLAPAMAGQRDYAAGNLPAVEINDLVLVTAAPRQHSRRCRPRHGGAVRRRYRRWQRARSTGGLLDVRPDGANGRLHDAGQHQARTAIRRSVIQVDVEGFGSLDWRRSRELMQRGYEAAEITAPNCSRTRWTTAPGRRGCGLGNSVATTRCRCQPTSLRQVWHLPMRSAFAGFLRRMWTSRLIFRASKRIVGIVRSGSVSDGGLGTHGAAWEGRLADSCEAKDVRPAFHDAWV